MSSLSCKTCDWWRDHWNVAECVIEKRCMNRRNKVMLGRLTEPHESCLMWKKRKERA